MPVFLGQFPNFTTPAQPHHNILHFMPLFCKSKIAGTGKRSEKDRKKGETNRFLVIFFPFFFFRVLEPPVRCDLRGSIPKRSI
jgi:hypothetical protein